jgi:hypothetical protein
MASGGGELPIGMTAMVSRYPLPYQYGDRELPITIAVEIHISCDTRDVSSGGKHNHVREISGISSIR